ncbi:S41 family peptidase [Kitasatospora cineracea]|uniref:Peptidase S41-like protein n=1 Tax=Kitasatospora cineracea TaxID=88074 RepID=A0A3N4RGD6_9ACTN|nr:S41 family peptidase [Kitasatospora cineracea]RPE31876.1 peptidase S41-like protein [Kitasatospora cineracea]
MTAQRAAGRASAGASDGRWRRLAAAGAVTVLLAAATGAGERLPADGNGGEPRRYLDQALDLMEQHSVLRDRTDWPRLRAEARRLARQAATPADTYTAISRILEALGDRHSFFWTPEQAAARTGDAQADPPRSRRLAGGAGYLALPAVGGPDRTAQDYVRRGREAVARTDGDGTGCGWIVDLRQNSGGNMWPMMAVVAPILGDGPVGAFVDADGVRTPWAVSQAAPLLGDRKLPWGPGTPVAAGPVAVLTDGRTASAAEAVLVAFRGRPDTRTFGTPTYGVPTANETYRLSDGALLGLTGARDADRTGRLYDSPIPPDRTVPTSPVDIDTPDDRTLHAAEEWITARCAG